MMFTHHKQCLNSSKSRMEALAKLPVPDAVFVGGSAGELLSIVEAALEKYSQVRLCVPCVTVETLTEACALLSRSRFKGFEACQVSAARAEAVGSHHLMTVSYTHLHLCDRK